MFRAHVLIHQEVKIALHSLWYYHTYGCDDDEQMCSKHVEARNILIVKQKFCASSWLITDIKTRVTLLKFCVKMSWWWSSDQKLSLISSIKCCFVWLTTNIFIIVFQFYSTRGIFGARRDEVTGEWRRLHNEELKRFVLLTQYCAGDKMEKNEMGWACGAYGWGVQII